MSLFVSITAYLSAVLVFHERLQGSFPMLSALPVMVVAHRYGVRGALWTAPIVIAGNLALIHLLGVRWLPAAFIGGHGVLVTSAVLLGWVTELRARLHSELEQRRQAEAMLREEQAHLKQLHAEQLRRADRLATLGTSVAQLAHEINNPLVPLMFGMRHVEGELRQLHSADPQRIDELLEEIGHQKQTLERLRSLAQDLRVLRPGPPQPAQRVDLHEIVTTALSTTRRMIEPGATVHVELCEVPPVQARPAQLVQVVLNLLLNARDALGPSCPRQEIRVLTHTTPDGRAVIEVEDTGMGISAKDLSQIFEPFFTTKGEAGTGLGLHVSQRIVEDHGGQLEVDSLPGVRTRFRIVLPPHPTLSTSEPEGLVH